MKYIREYNPTELIRIANNKVDSKILLEKNNIPTPKLLALIKSRADLENFDWEHLPKSFVVKPSRGYEGKGVEIIFNRKSDLWILSDGSKIDETYLKRKIGEMLDGKYSLGSNDDIVMIEERVKPHKKFRPYTYKGTPDVRVLLFKGVPIMAMLRIPTAKSNGRANLAQGAIGAAIDLAAGRVTNSIIGSNQIEFVPHNNVRLSGLNIPYWKKILRISAEVYTELRLGYMSVDFLIDREDGPLVLEINSNTGLQIQIANLDGIRWRTESLSDVKVKSPAQAVRVGQDLFGGQIEENIQNISGRFVIGIHHLADTEIFGIHKNYKLVINTTQKTSRVSKKVLDDFNLLQKYEELKLQILELVEQGEPTSKIANKLNKLCEERALPFEYIASKLTKGLIKKYLKFNVTLDEATIPVKARISGKLNGTQDIELGSGDLSNFIIDPTK